MCDLCVRLSEYACQSVYLCVCVCVCARVYCGCVWRDGVYLSASMCVFVSRFLPLNPNPLPLPLASRDLPASSDDDPGARVRSDHPKCDLDFPVRRILLALALALALAVTLALTLICGRWWRLASFSSL